MGAEFTHAVIDTEDGHVYAGACVETVVAGAMFLRLTVPSGAFLFFRGESMRRITPCTAAFAKAAGEKFAQPLAHIHLPEASAYESASGAGMPDDDVIWQNGYEDGYAAGLAARHSEETQEEDAFAQADAEAEAEARADDRRLELLERQRMLLPGEDGFDPPDDIRGGRAA